MDSRIVYLTSTSHKLCILGLLHCFAFKQIEFDLTHFDYAVLYFLNGGLFSLWLENRALLGK